MEFSRKLKILRKEKGYSQEYLAEQCGVSRQAVSKWESNTAYPETDKLIYLSELFEVSIDYLIKDSYEESQKGIETSSKSKQQEIDYGDCIGHWCNIELKNWDSGYYQAAITAQDKKYLYFYLMDKKRALKPGVLLKEHIDAVTVLDMNGKKLQKLPEIQNLPMDFNDPFTLFIDKECDIQIHSPSLSSFIFSADGYQKSIVTFVGDSTIKIKKGKNSVIVKKSEIVGIVES